jgi:hypothetical protein
MPCESPNPTTGESLYSLGRVRPGHDLYREAEADTEDEVIRRDSSIIEVKRDEHFYSGPKELTIIVNAQRKPVTRRRLSYDEIVSLAFNPPPTGANILITIVYRKGPRRNPEGTLQKGKTVRIKEGMIFNVRATDLS